jgi:hypothetical protein
MSKSDRGLRSTLRPAVSLAAGLLFIAARAQAAEHLAVGAPFELDAPVAATGGGPAISPIVVGGESGLVALWAGYGYGTRIDPATGARLDPDGLPALQALYALGQTYPVAASNGATALVLVQTDAWQGGEDSFAALLLDVATGEPAGDLATFLPGDEAAFSFGVAAMPGGDYLVAWIGDGGAVRGARVDGETGALLDDGSGFEIASGGASSEEIAVAGNAGGFLVIFASNDDGAGALGLRSIRVDADGTVPDANGHIAAADIGFLAALHAVGLDDGFAILWSTGQELDAAGVDADGAVTAPAAPVYAVDGDAYVFSFAVASSGAEAIATWHEDDPAGDWEAADIFAARVDLAGEVTASPRVTVCGASGPQEAPGIAFGGGRYFAAWQDARNIAWHIYGSRLDAAGAAPLDPSGVPVATFPNDEVSPLVAEAGDGFLVVWGDTRNAVASGTSLYGARVSSEGASLDPSGLAIADTPYGDYPSIMGRLGGMPLAFWSARDEADETGSLRWGAFHSEDGTFGVAGEIDAGAGWPEPAPVEIAGGALVPYATGAEIRAAFLTAVEEAPVVAPEPLYASPEEDAGMIYYSDVDLRAAAIGDTALLVWAECLSGGDIKGVGSCPLDARRFHVGADGAIEPSGELFTIDADCASTDLLARGDHFELLCATWDAEAGTGGVSAFEIAADPTAAVPVVDVGRRIESPYQLSGLRAVPFDGGLFLAASAFVPIEGVDGSLPAVFAAALGDALEVRAPFEEIQEGFSGFSAASRGDRLLLASEASMYGSQRVVGRMISVEPLVVEDAGADAGGDPDGGGASQGDGCGCDAVGAATNGSRSLLSLLAPF